MQQTEGKEMGKPKRSEGAAGCRCSVTAAALGGKENAPLSFSLRSRPLLEKEGGLARPGLAFPTKGGQPQGLRSPTVVPLERSEEREEQEGTREGRRPLADVMRAATAPAWGTQTQQSLAHTILGRGKNSSPPGVCLSSSHSPCPSGFS